MIAGNSKTLFEVFDFTEDNLAQALSNKHTSVDYIKRGKYHYNFLLEHLRYNNIRNYTTKTILIENQYISHAYLSDLGAEFIYSTQNYSKYCKRIHFFSTSFSSVDDLIQDSDEKKKKDIWASYRGFVTVKPLPKSRLGPIILEPYPPSKSKHRRFTALRSYTIHLLGQSIKLDSLAFMEQDGILSACSTVSIWSALHRLHTMFNVGILRPVVINNLAKYTAHNQPGALPGIGMDLHQICSVIEQTGLKVELRTLNGSLKENQEADEQVEVKDKKFIRKFIYAYLRMGLPIFLGLEFENKGKHLVTLVGYEAVNSETITREKNSNLPLTYADYMQSLYAHDDQVGPFSRIKLTGQGNQVKTSRWRDQFTNLVSNDSEVYSIIVPLSKDIKLTFEDIYKQVLYFESLFYELIETDQQFVWDIYLSHTNDYRKEIQQEGNTYSVAQQYKILTNFLPPYIWVARAEVAGFAEMEFIFDATALPYASDFCTSILFFDEVLKNLLAEALVDETDNDRDSLIHASGMNRLFKESFDLPVIWSFLKKTLAGNKSKVLSEIPNSLSNSEYIEFVEAKQPVNSNESIGAAEKTKPLEETDTEEKQVIHSSTPPELIKNEDDSPINIQGISSKRGYWKKKIAGGDIEPVLKEVQEFLENSEIYNNQINTIIAITGRSNRLEKNKMIGNMSYSRYNLEYNQITNILLDFIDSLKES